jgi:transcriptional regulator with GAF, ATPase, and Fis domain
MERFALVLLEVWREVCQHLDIGESLTRIIPLLDRRLPAKAVLVRRLEVARSWVETVAVAPALVSTSTPPARSPSSADEMQHLLVWCQAGRVEVGQTSDLVQRFPKLLPQGIDGDMLAAPLNTAEGPAGVFVVLAPPGQTFRSAHKELAAALREPLAVALENDRRLRELTALREAVEADNRSLLSRLGRHDISDSIVGAETGLKEVMEQIDLVARSDTPVLVLGETGSGKEVVARAIHTRSRRASAPFLRVNCGAIPPDLIDSELFGHERGSFTGAVGVRQGWFERANGGTLFLDECGELPLAVQVRLLRILQDGSFERVGGERQLHADVRIVAATHRDLHGMVTAGRFREDLWYRIAVFPIRLPPLRERRDDIPPLAAHFALRAAKRLGTAPLIPSTEDVGLLVNYPWPGNVRELAAVIERAAILGGGQHLAVAQALGTPAPQPRPLPDTTAPGPPSLSEPPRMTLDAAMARHIEQALVRTHGRIEGPDGAAELLDINPHTLRARMRKLGIDWRRFRRHRGATPRDHGETRTRQGGAQP